MICIHENRYDHSELEIKYHDTGNGSKFVSVSAWKNSVNSVIGGLMLLSPRTLKSQSSIEKIQLRMMCALFNSNPCTTIVSCYNPINASDKIDFIAFYNEMSTLVRRILKH